MKTLTQAEVKALLKAPTRKVSKHDREKLETGFVNAAKLGGLPIDQREYRFSPPRRWRFDFAWPRQMLAVEVEGGTHVNGGHSRGDAYAKNCEKYNAAVIRGWRVLRYTTEDLRKRPVQMIEEVKAALGAK